ncbi:MAG: translational GTPase TypA [Clostridiales bacterium]|jgi:GTP-binding protein|nr:translational GTPase TypA [Clostridiales bacterium]
MINASLRNIAIIAHVDHGKTTLVDQMLKQGGVFRANQQVEERVMDSNDLERERGITILAKNTSVKYGNYKINVVDTPGHADFGGEVERVLKMVNGVLLIVDAFEGPMPQTRFVLSKALELDLKVIVVINKIDRPDARLNEIGDEVLELLLELDATSEQLDSPIVYCSGRQGSASLSPNEKGTDLVPLFETIVRYIDPPAGAEGPLQMLVSSVDYSDYVGRIAIGRIERGSIRLNQQAVICDYYGNRPPQKVKISAIFQFEGLARVQVDKASAGDVVCVSGVEGVTIGDTVCDADAPEPLPFVKISEPSVEMTFAVNDSPFAGKEGKFVTSRHLRDRLYKETLKDVALRVSDTMSSDAFKVCGRGEMHLSILIENMRRDGYEFQVSMPRVLYKEVGGKRHEPVDRLVVDVPEASVGVVMNKMGVRKGELIHMNPHGDRMRMEFKIPARGLFGYKSGFLTDTKGEGIINSVFLGYEEYKGDIERRATGSLVAHESGDAAPYGLFYAQERGDLFIVPGVPVYEGMVVGENPKGGDVVVNVCKRKHLTNMRASGSDDALRLSPPRLMSLEEALEFIADDEYIEVTPKSIRIRKIVLNAGMRAKNRAGTVSRV